MIKLKSFFLVTLCICTLSACQTNMLKQFARVKNGMDKHDVVELMGSPNTTTRFHGKDRWLYVFYEDNVRYNKEIHFNDGIITYAGETWQPETEKKADIVDKKNESLNLALDLEDKQKKENARKAYSDYEKELRSEDKVQYMPVYTPVQ